MHVIQARNVHQALPAGLSMLARDGMRRSSRNGDVLVMDGPVTSVYERPCERVIFHADRDANPFFHFYESLWMLGGRKDVSSIGRYAASMKNYSDDGKTFHGAYGFRWRKWFGFDQLETVAETLRANRQDRRCVVQMWDSREDLGEPGKDFPCNTQVYFSVSFDGALDMTVCNRSNDVIWGCYGANAVHFSALQEFMAAWIGIPVGMYWQMSNNFHAYIDVFEKTISVADRPDPDPYRDGEVEAYPMISTDIASWQQDLEMFLDDVDLVRFNDPFFRRVAQPIVKAHEHFKKKELGEERFTVAREILEQCVATDWRRACSEYILRRENAWRKAQDDGPAHSA